MKTRFAPSPTGLMHFGNLRTALFNYFFAQKMQGIFLLRVEDTDLSRSTQEYYDCLIRDLKWVGVKWQEGPYQQSQRADVYASFYQQLEEAKIAYPCFCSEEQLAVMRKVNLASGKPPRYSGICRTLSSDEVQQKIAAGIRPALRFRIPDNKTIEFTDLIKGRQKFKTNDIGDFIIRRQDGSASFMFCNAIDDAQMQVTHVLRGEDHLTNTPRQIMILQALKLPVSTYGHFPMINGLDGSPLSKRNGSEAVVELCQQGFHPLAVVNYLARLGHYYSVTELLSMEALAEQFDLKHVNTAPAKHDSVHLRHWQKECMLRLTVAEFWGLIKQDVSNIVPASSSLAFAELILPNVLMPKEAITWAKAIFADNLELETSTKQEILQQAGELFFTTAYAYLINNPTADLAMLLAELKQVTGYNGKQLFLPLRIALTGEEHGPELVKILSIMGPERAKSRFKQAQNIATT